MLKIKFESDNGEVLEVPFIYVYADFVINQSNKVPLTIYENYYNAWIPEIPKSELENVPYIQKTYYNKKNNCNVRITYEIRNNSPSDTGYVIADINFRYGTSKYLLRLTYYYDTGHWYFDQGLYPVPIIDTKKHVFGKIASGSATIQSVEQRDTDIFITDTRYYTLKNDGFPSLHKKKYMALTSYFKGDIINPRTTIISTGDVNSKIYSEGEMPLPMWATNTDYSGEEQYTKAYELFFENIKIPTYPDNSDDDPQPDDDDPTPSPGDDDSDPIPKPPLPTWDVTNTGFVVIYNPTVTQIRELAYFMWSGDFADLIKKVFREPFQALISLKMLFCPIVSGPEQTVWLGNVETDVSMPKVTQQFVDVDMGTIQINEYFGSFADYEPYTRIQIFLPFIGYKELNTDEVMNSTLSLSYRVDVYSGACVAFLKITKTINGTPLDAILYQFDGNCAMEIPFTSNDNSRYIAAILNSASSASMAVANTSNFTPSQQPTQWTKGEKASLTIGSLAPVANGLIDIMATKPNVQRAGALAGAVAALGVKQPYIIIHRPIKHMPSNYSHYLGIPSNLAKKLSAVTGYTIVSQIFMSSAVATENEITMITEILKSGVII